MTLVNGVFSRKLDFTSGECGGSSLLAIIEATPASESIAIKITDSTNSRVYAAQAVIAMPYSFMSDVAKTLVQMGATTGQILTWNGTQWAPASAGGSGIGTITNIATGTGLTGGPITATGTISIATGGVTTTQILDSTIANIDVSTTAAIARTKLASGTASHVLVNDGSGVMSSVAQVAVTQGGTGASSASGARTNLGLGTAAVASIGTGIGGVMGSDAVPNCLASQKLQMSVGPVYAWTCATDATFSGGGLSSDIDMNSNKITELASPTVGTDAANKAYVDAQIAGVPSVQWDSVAGGHINFAGGRVGIGDTTPSEALDVAANARVAGDAQVEGKLRLKSTTANYVELSAPAGLAATRSFTLPSTLGSSGEVLTTDGLGGLSWSAVSGGGGGSNWTLASGDVYRTSGNVGIGTTSPQALLQVQGATNEVKLGPTTAASGNSELQIIGKNSGLEKPVRLWSNWDGDLYVRPNTGRGIFLQDGTGTTSLNVTASGTVGIGTTSPGSTLDVKGELRLSGSSSGYVGFTPAAAAGSTTYTLPSADGSTGYVLTTNGSGVLSWAAGGGGSTSVGGDLSGTVSNAQIAANAVGTTEIANSSVSYAKTNFADGDIPAAKVSGLTTGLAGKEASITAGTSAQYFRGDKTMQTLDTGVVPENGNLYFLDSRVRTALMSGYAMGSALPIAATDTLLEALAKLEGSIAAVQSNGQWTEGSGNVYRTSGNVGIGTASPTTKLQVDATNPYIGLNSTTTGKQSGLIFYDNTTTDNAWAVGNNYNNAGDGNFYVSRGASSTGNILFAPDGNGNVGIGKTAPAFKLDIGGSSALERRVGLNGTQIIYYPDEETPGSIFFGNGGASSAGGLMGNEGQRNTGLGIGALFDVEYGYENTAVGYDALARNVGGSGNTALGHSALIVSTGSNNIALGTNAGSELTTGDGNLIIGSNTGASLVGLSNTILIADGAGTERLRITDTGNVGIGVTAPTAALHLKAGTTAANTAPLKFTAGPFLTTASDGAMEYNGTNLSFTIGATRYTVPLTSSSGVFTSTSSVSNSSGNIELAPNLLSGSVNVTAGTSSVNSTSGALVVTGGVGVGGSIFSGGSVNAATNLSVGVNGFIPQLYGSSSAGGDILIDGTSNASKGDVLLATAAGGKVGIGTTTPSSLLDISGSTSAFNLKVAGYSLFTTAGSGGTVTISAPGGESGLTIQNTNRADIRFNDSTLKLAVGTGTTPPAATSGVSINSSGNVGIGTTSPGSKLQVDGDIWVNGMSTFRTVINDHGVRVTADGTDTHAKLQFTNSAANTEWSSMKAYPTSVGFNVGGGADAMTILNSGNVGIGVLAPAAKLDISGTSGFTLKITDGNQGAGKVLTSDADGVASWTAPASGSAWAIKTSAYTAAVGDRLMVDTSGGAVTVTLPASASLGDTIAIIDVAGAFATNALTVARNGLRIMGLTEDMTVSSQNISFELVYSNATYGWRIK